MPWKNTPDDRRRSSSAYDARYRRNREKAMRRDNWRCQIRIPGICITAASECDHIVSRNDGGGNDLANLRAACGPCHANRTAHQGNAVKSGARPDPQPSPRTSW